MSVKVRNSSSIPAFTAGDLTEIRELFHPLKGSPDLPFSLAYGSLKTGKSSIPHRLRCSKEVYYILSGTARLTVNEEQYDLREGDYFCVPKNELQFLANTGRKILQFLCIVSPPWKAEEEDVSGK